VCKYGNQVCVNLPDFLATEERLTVSIDSCIVDVIQDLWIAGVVTVGCCCGHHFHEAANVIIESHHAPIDLALAYEILCGDKKRRWEILQWRLITVAEKPKVGLPEHSPDSPTEHKGTKA